MARPREEGRLNESTKRHRVERAEREIHLGYWSDPEWVARVVSLDEIHFGFLQEGRDNIRRKAKDHLAWWAVSNAVRNNAVRNNAFSENNGCFEEDQKPEPPVAKESVVSYAQSWIGTGGLEDGEA
ncbi:hypothetical protein DL766_008952 [Monosporascus sp. MC13-8B]|uniref:Uncharacterized protein n=1 Tax=Monosporascus cannonballus TaxID=155416 RepID=A0ABY0GTK4_9PEZI|nr:hypothetical protein DL762_009664 [Monosporascus cannonballus]RYO84900.1 hypothetical protein DL763_007310 [Monosporascus cannonballus]RYP17219.1 hypothetical protein DL766_008952 [Monosporascus sp. MC13-8B]